MTTNYTLDLAAGLTQVLDDGTNTYLYGNGRIAQASSTTEYFLGDALGSVRQLVDTAGAVTLTQSYAPYGETVSSVGNGHSVYQYTGEIRDTNGLTYLRSRYLDARIGRFISKDSWNGEYLRPLSLNRWGYVEGNPVNFVDPYGYYQCKDVNCDVPVGQGPYARFDKTLDFIYNEMIRNSRGNSANLMRAMLDNDDTCSSTILFGYESQAGTVSAFWTPYMLFMLKVGNNQEWDHKRQLRSLLNIQSGNKADEYYPIRGDEEFEYYYDIWSNIHYGYVGSSIGFDNKTLQDMSNLAGSVPPFLKGIVEELFGQFDPGDVISVDIGLKLWTTHQYNLSKQDIHKAILQKTQEFFRSQDINGNGEIDNSEIDPSVGKLIPRGRKKLGELIGDWK